LQCQALQQENNVLVNEVNELKAAVAQLERIIDEGDSRGAQLGMQLMAAQVILLSLNTHLCHHI
jgi:hypothetical protein